MKRTGRLLTTFFSFLVLFLCIGIAASAYAAQKTQPITPVFQVSASASPSTLKVNQTESIIITATSNVNVLSYNFVATIFVNGKEIAVRRIYDVPFTAGQPVTRTITWLVPSNAPVGTYSVIASINKNGKVYGNTTTSFSVTPELLACGNTASGQTVTTTISTTSGSTTATTQQCPYGGTQPTTTTITQVQLCTNGTLTNQGSPVTTVANTGSPTCNAAAACGSTPSGQTVIKTVSTTTGSIDATLQQCPYGGTQPTTTTITQAQLCTNGTLTNQGSPVTTVTNTGTPTCNTAASCGSTPSGQTVTTTVSTTPSTIAATPQQCPYGGTQPVTTTVTQTALCTNGTLTNQGNPVSTVKNNGSPTCNAPANCSATTESWTVAGVTCSGLITSTASGAAGNVTSSNGNTGSASYACTNGIFSINAGSTCSAPVPSGVPAPAAAAGFNTETFATSNFSTSNVDMGLTGKPGFQWYFIDTYNYYTPNSAATILNADGSALIGAPPGLVLGSGNMTSVWYNYDWSQYATLHGPVTTWHGKSFGGGGYFEATFAYDQTKVNMSNGWPAWWGFSHEHSLQNGSDQWPGQAAGYNHFIEMDFFEADTGAVGSYGGAIHDWSGINSSTNLFPAWNVVDRIMPAGTDEKQYHQYGFLWVPATATKQGSLTYYFDRKQIGPTVFFSQYTNQAPPISASSPWLYGIGDLQHLDLIIGGGINSPMLVKDVEVWQLDESKNITN